MAKLIAVCHMILFAFSLTTIGANNNKTSIHIGALIPHLDFRDRFCFASSVKLAVEKINDSNDILPNHHIVLHLRETHVSIEYFTEPYWKTLDNSVTVSAKKSIPTKRNIYKTLTR